MRTISSSPYLRLQSRLTLNSVERISKLDEEIRLIADQIRWRPHDVASQYGRIEGTYRFWMIIAHGSHKNYPKLPKYSDRGKS